MTAEQKPMYVFQLKVTNNTSKLESLSPRQATLPEITLYGSILTALSDQQARIKQCAKKKQQVPEVKQTNVKTTTRHHVLSESKGPNLLTVPSKARVPLLKFVQKHLFFFQQLNVLIQINVFKKLLVTKIC